MVLAALLALAMALFAMAIGSQMWSSYKSDVVGQQKSQMILLAQALAADFSNTISYRVEDLENLSAIFQEENARDLPQFATEFIALLLEKPYIQGVVLRSSQGDLFWGCDGFSVASVNATTQYSPDIALLLFQNGQDQLGYMMEQTLSDGRTVSLLLDLTTYYKELTKTVFEEDASYVSIQTAQNITLFHPATALVGLEVLEGCQALYGDVDLSGATALRDYQNAHLWGFMNTNPIGGTIQSLFWFAKLPPMPKPTLGRIFSSSPLSWTMTRFI
ncbi:hypothetical protein RFF05_10055 [Bengtsoniella intestinalis]|uniref:hypothetical protein n=1 Tax=Bengtsoniella intestinalis TaxID=3073143 RepID=UPI00391F460A